MASVTPASVAMIASCVFSRFLKSFFSISVCVVTAPVRSGSVCCAKPQTEQDMASNRQKNFLFMVLRLLWPRTSLTVRT